MATVGAEVAACDRLSRGCHVRIDQLGLAFDLDAAKRRHRREDHEKAARRSFEMPPLDVALRQHDLEGSVVEAKPHGGRKGRSVLPVGGEDGGGRCVEKRLNVGKSHREQPTRIERSGVIPEHSRTRRSGHSVLYDLRSGHDSGAALMPRPGFIDHIGIGVPDLVAAKEYYDDLMSVLGLREWFETGPAGPLNYGPDGEQGSQLFFYEAEETGTYSRLETGLHHLAFLVASRAIVREAHQWARTRDAVILDEPQEFPQYGPHCFATYWLDPHGFKLEAVCHAPEES